MTPSTLYKQENRENIPFYHLLISHWCIITTASDDGTQAIKAMILFMWLISQQSKTNTVITSGQFNLSPQGIGIIIPQILLPAPDLLRYGKISPERSEYSYNGSITAM